MAWVNNFASQNKSSLTMQRIILILALLSITQLAFSQENTTNKFDFDRIEDNSFLLEEAYNQEDGVIQHISAFQYMKDKTWSYNFTEEWPAPKQKHQLSVTIPVVYSGSETGFGDVALNYRYQAVLSNRLAFSPRLSLVLPSGNYENGNGYGVIGYQINLPLSFIANHKIVTHFNLGTTYSPEVKGMISQLDNNSEFRPDIFTINYGGSVIFLASANFNFMLEAAGNSMITSEGDYSEKSSSFFLNPGIRYAFNFKSGLQIVPGLAIPIGVGPSSGKSGLFAYLSFEHPLWKP